MEALLALLQTFLWVGLIGGIVWRFNKPIHALLSALADRIQSGSDFKAGPFEITKQLHPQTPDAQTKKVDAEIREETQLVLPSSVSEESAMYSLPPIATSLRARHYEAEDLALRAVQDEFGVPINRQLTGGRDAGFDGAFVKQNAFHIVEIKISSGRYPRPIVAKAASQISSTVENYQWRNVRIIIVLVVIEEDRLVEAREQLLGFIPNSKYPVDVRCYSFKELRGMFGLGGE